MSASPKYYEEKISLLGGQKKSYMGVRKGSEPRGFRKHTRVSVRTRELCHVQEPARAKGAGQTGAQWVQE